MKKITNYAIGAAYLLGIGITVVVMLIIRVRLDQFL